MSSKFSGSGCTDQPAVVDQFKIQKYIGGLVTFISSCSTPMTIAVQGDWGTGKTSVMQMVRDQLQKEDPAIQEVWFNTWQFSQFEMGSQLPLLLMSKLLRNMGDKPGIKEMLGAFASKIAGVAADAAIGRLSNGTASAEAFRPDGDELKDTVDKIEKLKDEFQALINAQAGENGRVVVFVDDLDRLQPGRAVELLEVLKIFLDCEKCVFVLAIDYSVVSRGVKEKYGKDFSDAKGRSFFDKIIQVPFKMPVASYDIGSYVKENLAQIGVTVRDNKQLAVFVSLIESSIGNNPRSMKRLFNSFLLLRGIADDRITADPHNEEILFALLCMQSQYEAAYNHLMKHRGKAIENLLDCLSQTGDEESEDTDHPFFTGAGMNGEDQADARRGFLRFGRIFYNVIDKDHVGGISEEELQTFQDVLAFSSITATDSAGDTGVRSRGSEVVDNVDSLHMKYKSQGQKQAMYDWLRAAVPEAYVEMINANSGYSLFSVCPRRGETRFTQIEDLKTGWKFYYKLPPKLRDADPQITALAEGLECKLGGTWAELKTPVQIEDERVAKLLQMIYEIAAR